MKKITYLFLLLLSFSVGYSQDLLLGFETTESGGVNGDPFGNGPAPVIETGTGTNTSRVLKITGNPNGEPWQGINLNLSSLVNLSATKTMTMDVFSETSITFLVKVTGGTTGPPTVAASASHPGGSTWQTISFTFDTALDGQGAPANGNYNGFVIHTYCEQGATGFFNPDVSKPVRTFFVDNIRGPLGSQPVDAAPTEAAPAPPARLAADVKSLFSDAYTPITALNYAGVDGQPSNDNTFNTSWSPANTSLVQVEGNDVNKIVGLGFEGISFLAGRFDASTFTHFHIDIWTATPTLDKSFNLKFSNWNNGSAEANAIEYSITNANLLTNPNDGSWYSFDIPFSSWTPGSRNDFVQFIITSDLGTVYYDNLYLHKNTVLDRNEFAKNNLKMYPNPSREILNISSETVIESILIYNTLGQIVHKQESNNETVNISNLAKGVYILSATSGEQVFRKQFIKE